MSGQLTKPQFDRYLAEYWIPRLTADGIDPNDIHEVGAQIESWRDWPEAWSDKANEYIKLAIYRQKQGSTITAGDAFVRASLCYHVGQLVAGDRPVIKQGYQVLKSEVFRNAAPLLDPPAISLRISRKGPDLPGYLRLPINRPPPHPCVLLVPGLDSTKEDFITVSELCARRGLATFAFDGPGQGEVWLAEKLAEGYEACIQDAFQAIAAREDIDASRIGLLGRSLGGYYVLRAAARESGVGACVVFGGTYDLSDWDRMPDTIHEGFRYATGSETTEEARSKMGDASLDDCIEQISCPVLVIHGRQDRIFNAQQAVRIADEIGAPALLMMDETGTHCCHNHAFEYRTAMADWLSNTL